MGTTWSVKLVLPAGISAEQIQCGVQQKLDQVVGQMSTWLDSSDLSRFNRAEAGSWHVLPEEFFKVLDHACYVAQQSNGAYDPTVGSLVNLWGFGPDGPGSACGDTPAAEAISGALERKGWTRLQLDRLQRRVFQPGGIYVDLSSIAKGFGVDQVAGHLQQQGVHSYLVEVGGELRGYGSKPDGDPWWVALEQPLPSAAEQAGDVTVPAFPPTIVALHELSIATSGDYRRFFDIDGKRYAHTIDPRTGYPVPHALASVAVLHASCMIADALATALTVLGAEEGMQYARQHHIAAHFVSRTEAGFEEKMSPACKAMLE